MFGLGPTELLIILLILFIALVPEVFYLMTLRKALNRCSPQNRTINPALVWLLFIPVFDFIWHFIIVNNIAKSLHNEFAMRNIEAEPSPGEGIGFATCILQVISLIPVIGVLTGIAGFVCWIIYWVKIAGFSNKLATPLNQPIMPHPIEK